MVMWWRSTLVRPGGGCVLVGRAARKGPRRRRRARRRREDLPVRRRFGAKGITSNSARIGRDGRAHDGLRESAGYARAGFRRPGLAQLWDPDVASRKKYLGRRRRHGRAAVGPSRRREEQRTKQGQGDARILTERRIYGRRDGRPNRNRVLVCQCGSSVGLRPDVGGRVREGGCGGRGRSPEEGEEGLHGGRFSRLGV